jgi:hypothetical protein
VETKEVIPARQELVDALKIQYPQSQNIVTYLDSTWNWTAITTLPVWNSNGNYIYASKST